MKRRYGAMAVLTLATTCLWVGNAGAQETPATIDDAVAATTVAPTTEVPTTAAPAVAAPEESTTTVAPEVEAPAAAAAAPLVAWPGELVTSGTLSFDIRFADSPASSCKEGVDLKGSQVNVGRDDKGSIGTVYGLAKSGNGHAGVFTMGLGALPFGVGLVSVSDGTCEFDAIGIGTYESSNTVARLNGVGAGLHPGAYDHGDYINTFVVETQIGGSAAPAALDLPSVASFLLRPRAGLIAETPGVNTAAKAETPASPTSVPAA
ncbi:MAG: hypothetical protein R2698_03400 [Microthrixaceae bacterium]